MQCHIVSESWLYRLVFYYCICYRGENHEFSKQSPANYKKAVKWALLSGEQNAQMDNSISSDFLFSTYEALL